MRCGAKMLDIPGGDDDIVCPGQARHRKKYKEKKAVHDQSFD
jgi:hypothetical protein